MSHLGSAPASKVVPLHQTTHSTPRSVGSDGGHGDVSFRNDSVPSQDGCGRTRCVWPVPLHMWPDQAKQFSLWELNR